jgi:DnaJ-domain-containing protein 1
MPSFELEDREAQTSEREAGPRQARRDPSQPTGRGGARARRGQPRGGAASRGFDSALARCYAELEVAQGADLRQVRRAWIRLVRRHHPDCCGADPERQRIGTERMKNLNRAYEEIRRRLQISRGESRR